MKRLFTGVAVLLAVTLCSGLARGADSPVTVTHEIAGYDKGSKETSIDYILHVTNRGGTTLSNVTLSVVPAPLFLQRRVTVDAGTLAPGQGIDLPCEVSAVPSLNKEKIMREPLLLAGTYSDSDGKTVEFPAKSYRGGVR